MVNLISISTFRHYAPVNSIVDESQIAASINHAQESLVPTIFGRVFYNHLINSVVEHTPDPILEYLAPALSALSASNLALLISSQMFPANVETAPGDPIRLSNYYKNMCSTYLKSVYAYCDSHNIDYTPWKSISFSPINLSGGHARFSH